MRIICFEKRLIKREEMQEMCIRVKREKGVLVSSMREMRVAQKGHFECLMNVEIAGKAIVSSMGIETGVCKEKLKERR